jgi:hypothetical protein
MAIYQQTFHAHMERFQKRNWAHLPPFSCTRRRAGIVPPTTMPQKHRSTSAAAAARPLII